MTLRVHVQALCFAVRVCVRATETDSREACESVINRFASTAHSGVVALTRRVVVSSFDFASLMLLWGGHCTRALRHSGTATLRSQDSAHRTQLAALKIAIEQRR